MLSLSDAEPFGADTLLGSYQDTCHLALAVVKSDRRRRAAVMCEHFYSGADRPWVFRCHLIARTMGRLLMAMR